MPIFGNRPAGRRGHVGAAGGRQQAGPDRGRRSGRGVHLRPVGVRVRAARRGRVRAARLRGRVVDLPRGAAGRALVAEPGTPGPDPGHVQRPGAGHGPDAGRGRSSGRRRDRRRAAPDADVRLGPERARVRRHRDRGPPPDRRGRPPRPRRPRVHLGPVRAGLLPAARGRRGAGRVRARHVRVPHRAPVGHAGAAAGRPEPGDAPVHPGRLRGARAGPDPDAGRGDAGPVVGHRRGQRRRLQPRLGRARHRVPGHRHGHPPPGRRAPAAGNLAQAHLHPGPGR